MKMKMKMKTKISNTKQSTPSYTMVCLLDNVDLKLTKLRFCLYLK